MQHLLRPLLSALAFAAGLALSPGPSAEPFFIVIAETETPQAQGDVLDVAAAAGQFQTFLAMVEAAGMEETLRGEGPFTIFAPTDAAFDQMSKAEPERLMQPRAHDELIALVSYHVVPERLSTSDLTGRTRRIEAASGYMLALDARDGLRVNDELVVAPDIEAQNGVIQGVNVVLSPPVAVAMR